MTEFSERPPELWRLRRFLAEQLRTRRLLYLDLRYWNDLCDVAIGESNDATATQLLEALRAAVTSGKVLCPIEYHTFAELYKQRLPGKRRATARVIDELSLGVVLVSPPERCFLEALRLIQALQEGRSPPLAPRDEVWTKVAFLMGHLDPPNDFPEEMSEFLTSHFHVHLWDFGFSELIEQLEEFPRKDFDRVKTVRALNESKRHTRQQFSSYRQIYLSEAKGALDGFAASLADVGAYLFERAGGEPEQISPDERTRAGEGFARVLGAAFQKRDMSQHLPIIHVHATLYAHMQWDGARQYKPNDLEDFGHAAAALFYFDAFATDRPMAVLLEQSKLTKQYKTQVLATRHEVLYWLADAGDPSTN